MLVEQPKVDILRLREIARHGLPDRETRVKVWPILLGIDAMDVKEDKKTLKKFTLVHTAGKQLTANYDLEKQAYLALKREYDLRKHDFMVRATTNEVFDGDASSSETADDETKDSVPIESTVFTEAAPVPPALPTFPTVYWDQISQDVDRSLWKQVPDVVERAEKRDQLHRIISAVICTTLDEEGKSLHYFQGYHDIASVCLLTCGETLGFSLLRRLSTSYLRYFLPLHTPFLLIYLQIQFTDTFPLLPSQRSDAGPNRLRDEFAQSSVPARCLNRW